MSVSHAVRVVPCDRTEVNVGDELVIAEFSWFSDLKSAARWAGQGSRREPTVLPRQLLVPVVQSLDVDAQELPRNLDVEQPSRGRNDLPQASLFRACQKRVLF